MKTKLFLLFFLLSSIGFVNAQSFSINGVNYSISNETEVIVTSNSCYSGYLNLPSSVATEGKLYTVARIVQGAFENCNDLTGISIPNSVRYVGQRAFVNCTNLQTVEMSDSLNTIAENTFFGCSNLSDVTLPNSILTIEERAFENCTSLETVTLPSTINKIGDYAFNNSGLHSINIPKSLETILDETYPFGTNVFANCKFTNFEFPTFFEYIPVGFLSGNEELTNISLPTSIEEILANSFSGCILLTDVALPSSVVGIGGSAFAGCKEIDQIILPENLEILVRP